MEIAALVISIISMLISIFATISANVIANKPYKRCICISETFPNKENKYGFSISNVGRESIYLDRIELQERRNGHLLGCAYFTDTKNKVFTLEPGKIEYITINYEDKKGLMSGIDINPNVQVAIIEKKGKKTIFKDFFPVG